VGRDNGFVGWVESITRDNGHVLRGFVYFAGSKLAMTEVFALLSAFLVSLHMQQQTTPYCSVIGEGC